METPFTDIEGHWGRDYIGYYYENGLISGTSATTFTPEAELTDYECVKMLLAVRGYPFISGDDWREQVTARVAGSYELSGAVWSGSVIATSVHHALIAPLYQSEVRLFEENFGLTETGGQIIATDQLALRGGVQEEGHFALETEDGVKIFPSENFDYTWLGRSVILYHDATDALVMVFYEGSVRWITGGKCDVTVEGQSVRMETPDEQWYRRTFTDAEWSSEILFIHSFGAVQNIKISELFDESMGYVTGMTADRVVLGYSNVNDSGLLYALSFTNTLEQVGEIDYVHERIQLGETWYDVGSLGGARTGDFVVFSVSGVDGKVYMEKLEPVIVEILSSEAGIVETAEGTYRLADGAIDPSGLLLEEDAFAVDKSYEVYTLRDIIYTNGQCS